MKCKDYFLYTEFYSALQAFLFVMFFLSAVVFFHLTEAFFFGIKALIDLSDIFCSSVAQSVERVAVNHLVGGSSPSRGARDMKKA